MLRRRGETVAAPATAPGRAALGVVRISGPKALGAIRSLVGRTFEDRRPALASLPEAGRAMVTFYRGPRSYTGEDLVEVALHGNPLLEEALLRRLGEEGVLPALPGEFTFRAVLNGKMDLVQAEGIAALIDAQTPLQVRRALDGANGALSARLGEIKEKMTEAMACLEAAIEFPEEGTHGEGPGARKAVEEAAAAARALSGSCLSAPGSGIPRVSIAGPPNAGKSTLFNRLAGNEKAMVTSVSGTTRDGLMEEVRIGGRAVLIEDTAGLFASEDPVTALAAERAEASLDGAERIIWLADASRPRAGQELERAAARWGGRVAVAANKADLGVHPDWTGKEPVFSGLTGEGMEGVRALLSDWAEAEERRQREAAFFVNWRQEQALKRVADHLERAGELAGTGALELAAQEVNDGAAVLADLAGEIPSEAVLDHIFASFCIGK